MQESSTFSAHNNIFLLQKIENYIKWAVRMQFYLGGIQAIDLITKDSLWLQNRNFSKKNLKLT